MLVDVLLEAGVRALLLRPILRVKTEVGDKIFVRCKINIDSAPSQVEVLSVSLLIPCQNDIFEVEMIGVC